MSGNPCIPYIKKKEKIKDHFESCHLLKCQSTQNANSRHEASWNLKLRSLINFFFFCYRYKYKESATIQIALYSFRQCNSSSICYHLLWRNCIFFCNWSSSSEACALISTNDDDKRRCSYYGFATSFLYISLWMYIYFFFLWG